MCEWVFSRVNRRVSFSRVRRFRHQSGVRTIGEVGWHHVYIEIRNCTCPACFRNGERANSRAEDDRPSFRVVHAFRIAESPPPNAHEFIREDLHFHAKPFNESIALESIRLIKVRLEVVFHYTPLHVRQQYYHRSDDPPGVTSADR